MSYNMLAELGDWKVHRYLRELNLRASVPKANDSCLAQTRTAFSGLRYFQGGNYISYVGSGLKGNHELRMLDLSENLIFLLENLDDLDLRLLNMAQNKLNSLEGWMQRTSSFKPG